MKARHLVVVFGLTACTPTQVQTGATTINAGQARIAQLCSVAMALVTSPATVALASPVAPWITGGCATDELVAALALNPTSEAWLEGLIVKAGGKVPTV